MNERTKSLLILSVCMGLSFAIMILSCAFYSNWLAVTMLAPLFFLPVPVLFIDLKEKQGVDDEGARAGLALWYALVGALVVAFYGIPLVAIHADKIEVGQFILWMVANLLTTIAVIYYFMKRGDEY